MKKIILASRSPARRALLRQIGLPFRVRGSRVLEDRITRGDCGRLVVRNATAKARGVARGLRSGVVVGADTVVLVGGKIVGKPGNLEEAYRTLRMLSRKPQWVYTGVAVVDAATGRTFTACEKTRVCMRPLRDEEIRRYLEKISPLHLAGSFDIQGMGGAFVTRIEGCYYNVVGLPLAALVRLLARAGVRM
ncbi:MAG: Maf family protein [Candidatus Aureabacteria bacterium]|nr:Maf family protein [Candidatus Auribacterota bacterium]